MNHAAENAPDPVTSIAVLSRRFEAPVELVFSAWTEAEHFARWFGPRGIELPVVELDARPGGRIRFCHRWAGHPDIWVQGTFDEVVRPERLVFTLRFVSEAGEPIAHPMIPDWPVDARLVTSVSFANRDGATEIVVQQVVHAPSATPANRRAVTAERELAAQGWSETLDRLGELLSGP